MPSSITAGPAAHEVESRRPQAEQGSACSRDNTRPQPYLHRMTRNALLLALLLLMMLPAAVLAQAQSEAPAEAPAAPAATDAAESSGEGAESVEPLMTTQPADSPEDDFHWADVGRWIQWTWNLPVLRVGEAEVRVSQIVLAVVVLIVGLVVARRITRLIRNRLMSRTPLDVSAAAALEQLMFYVLMVAVFLMALQTVSIPITMFAFLGGAIAIGLGFGAQNIFNNFISGLILMLERPIRLGDTVEVGEHYGRIADIGARCTRVRRFDGVDVLVPNSFLLENAVVNWTLADKQVRQVVRVGAAYGSDVHKAREMLLKAVENHPDVLTYIEPRVIFEDFGDNALLFDLYFWLELSESINMRTIRSEIRFRINDLFSEAGITIAFPQRDVHLDTLTPLDVRVLQQPATPRTTTS